MNIWYDLGFQPKTSKTPVTYTTSAPLKQPNYDRTCTWSCPNYLKCHNKLMNEWVRMSRLFQEPLYIECLVCGRVYGGGPGGPGSGGPGSAPCDRPSAGPGPAAVGGEQPAGSMAWALQPQALPQHPHCTGSILVTYKCVCCLYLLVRYLFARSNVLCCHSVVWSRSVLFITYR